MVVDLENRRKRKTFETNIGKGKSTSEYVKGEFVIKTVNSSGQVILVRNNKEYKIFIEYPKYRNFEIGQVIKCMLSKKVFFVYWELEYTY